MKLLHGTKADTWTRISDQDVRDKCCIHNIGKTIIDNKQKREEHVERMSDERLLNKPSDFRDKKTKCKTTEDIKYVCWSDI